MHRHFGFGLLAAASTLALTATAAAQTGQPGQPSTQQGQGQAAAQPAANGATVIVTANKQEEQLHNVAQSVSAVTEQKIEQLQTFNFADYTKFVPGLTLIEGAPGDNQLVLRGLNSGGVASTVGTYIDETPYGSSSSLANGVILAPDLNAFDMQRVEVLRGPQGTLYGASTLGGLLKFVTNAPNTAGLAAEGEATGDEVENSGGWSVKGMLNVPIGSEAALRVAADARGDPGFINDTFRHLKDVNDTSEQGVRASFLARPTSALTIRLTAIAQDFRANDTNSEDIAVDGAGVPIEPISPAFGPRDNQRFLSGFNHVQNRLYNGTVNWNLGWSTLTSSTSYGTYDSQSLADTSAVLNSKETASLVVNKFTEEDRLQSQAGRPFEWLAGFYYTRETGDLTQRLIGQGAPFGAGTLIEIAHVTSAYEEEAGFATVTYHFTPQFDVAVGGRYAHNNQTSTTFEAIPLFGVQSLTHGPSNDSTFTYSVAPRWRPNEDVTVYARVATGFQPGGPNDVALGTIAAVPRTFGPDTVTSYEVGAKAELFDHMLSFDADAFHIDWRDIQLLAVVAHNGVNVNGGTARSDGLEAQGILTPIAGLTFSANVAYIDARLTSNTNALLGGKSGDPLPFAPKWSGTIDGVYTWSINTDIDAFVGATWAYVGDRKSDFSGTIGQVSVPSYNTWDLRAGVNCRKMWTVEVFAKNVGDVRGISSLGPNISAISTGESVTIIQPRTVGVTLTARY
jgi:iron complex outermembrane receptor protein